MSFSTTLISILAILTLIFFLLWRRKSIQLAEISFRKNSLSSRYGKLTEQFLPFLKDYPYNPENFRFLGSPIDGIQFEDNKIIFIEFKTADSKLSERQKQIAELIWQKRVEFEERRIE